MADYILVASSDADANPYTPANISVPVGTMRNYTGAGLSCTGSGAGFLAVHNVAYGDLITTKLTLGANLGSDLIQLLAIVRSGANANATVGVHVIGTTVQFKSETPAEVMTSNGTATLASSPVSGDVLIMTYRKSTGNITLSINGTNITSSGDANDTTYSAETSLSAGWGVYGANDGSVRVGMVELTGVSAGGASAKLLSMLNNQAGF